MIATGDAIALIMRAGCLADLFGDGCPGYRKLARAVRPDAHPGNADETASELAQAGNR